MILASERMLHADGSLAPGWVALDAGRVTATGHGHPDAADRTYPYLAPGLVDTHCHGGGGASFATTDADEARHAAATHRERGTTTLIASLVTAPIPALVEQVRTLVPLVHNSTLAGIHLEGPCLSPHRVGAHDPQHLCHPTPDALEALLDAGQGTIRMVTLAPELPGALDAIHYLTARGVTAAIGHTDCDAETAKAALDAGARVVTHLWNAMPPLHHRGPGPAGAALAATGPHAPAIELIADGIHVHPDVIATTFRAAQGRLSLVSDAMSAACCADGAHRLGSMDVTVTNGVARTPSGAIAGSTATLADTLPVAAASGIDAGHVLLAATATPARALGLDAGHLRPGAPADLIGLDDNLAVCCVWHGAHEAPQM